VLNVAEAPPGTAYVANRERGLPIADLSVDPCASCPSLCCSMLAIVSTVDAVHLAANTGQRLGEIVEAKTWHAQLGTLMGWPFKLDGARAVLAFRRVDGACAQLVNAGQVDSGCGVYEHRASICRLYPFDLEVDGERIRAGSQVHCGVQWLQNDALRARIASDLERYRQHRAIDLQIVRYWNRGARRRSEAGFLGFLGGPVAAELGYAAGQVRP
jgi:Fe-S-cluster containining protein